MKKTCPHCGKEFSSQGIAGHIRLKHLKNAETQNNSRDSHNSNAETQKILDESQENLTETQKLFTEAQELCDNQNEIIAEQYENLREMRNNSQIENGDEQENSQVEHDENLVETQEEGTFSELDKWVFATGLVIVFRKHFVRFF